MSGKITCLRANVTEVKCYIFNYVALLFNFKCKVSSCSWVSPYNEVLFWGHATFQAHHSSTFLHIDKHSSKHLLVVFLTMKMTFYSPLDLKAGLFILSNGCHGPPKYDHLCSRGPHPKI